MYKILIVEDDDAIACALIQHFSAWGMTCRRVAAPNPAYQLRKGMNKSQNWV